MKTGKRIENNNEFLSFETKQEYSNLANSISNFYCPEGLVNPEIIATKNGITYCYGNYADSFDGLIEHLFGEFHVYINIDRLIHPYTERARFTFAHELGHYFIDQHRIALKSGKSQSHSSFTGFVSKNYAEREADYFASCLLLPENRFKADIHRRKFSFEILLELSKKYQTSFTATALRFASIGNHPIIVVLSYKKAVKWYWYSNDFPYKSLRHSKSKVPDDTVAGDYYSNGYDPRNRQEVLAIDWFDYVRDSDVDRKFYEQCLFHKDYVLSIIWED
jgi:Zn-dependent peptidase ImmA (M78 family)